MSDTGTNVTSQVTMVFCAACGTYYPLGQPHLCSWRLYSGSTYTAPQGSMYTAPQPSSPDARERRIRLVATIAGTLQAGRSAHDGWCNFALATALAIVRAAERAVTEEGDRE